MVASGRLRQIALLQLMQVRLRFCSRRGPCRLNEQQIVNGFDEKPIGTVDDVETVHERGFAPRIHLEHRSMVAGAAALSGSIEFAVVRLDEGSMWSGPIGGFERVQRGQVRTGVDLEYGAGVTGAAFAG